MVFGQERGVRTNERPTGGTLNYCGHQKFLEFRVNSCTNFRYEYFHVLHTIHALPAQHRTGKGMRTIETYMTQA